MSRRVIIFCYRLLLAIGFPLLLLYLLVRIARDRRYARGLAERFGRLPFQPTQRGGIWLHAVSVGEVLSAVALVEKLKQLLPTTPVYVSVTTTAGRELAEKRLKHLADGLFYAPIDYVFAVRAVLRRLDPLAVVILETEIWPNLWHETRRRQAALLVINGRLSDQAWPKYQRWQTAFAPILQLPHHIYAQSQQDAARYRSLGAPRVTAGGNLKYDIAVPPPNPEIKAWIAAQNPGKIFIAASTMPAVTAEDRQEDEIVLDAHLAAAQAYPRLLTILAPRRPERFTAAAQLLHQRNVHFVKRSQLANLELPGVLLLDSMGELAGLFELAGAVFVGGSLVHWGGHNVLEPAASGRPILVGPHMQNFAAIHAEFLKANALIEVPAPEALGTALIEALRGLGSFGDNARRAAEKHKGATAQAAQAIVQALDQHVTSEPGLRWRQPLAWLYQAGLALDRRLRANPARLAQPVISIGNLTTGGTGKTPLVDWLARQLDGSAILTRGYGRQSSQDLILAPGQTAPASQTGDEAQTYLRSGQATVGIGAHRRRVAAQIPQAQRFLLDDGFQHWPLPRDLDIVLIDTTDPFGGGHLLPRGRLREQPSSLARAQVIVLTRAEPARHYTELRRRLGRPAFTARTIPVAWHPAPLPPGPYTAVCGLANPGPFHHSLRQLGLDLAQFLAFPDHHAYRAADLATITTPILTTEKDFAKIHSLGLSVSVHWLEIQFQLDDPSKLLSITLQAGAKQR